MALVRGREEGVTGAAGVACVVAWAGGLALPLKALTSLLAAELSCAALAVSPLAEIENAFHMPAIVVPIL